MANILIVGCGYTGRLVAQLLADSAHRQHDVIATSRNIRNLSGFNVTPMRFDMARADDIEDLCSRISPESYILLSTPVVDERLSDAVRAAKRLVFLSTTGVYGAQRDVDETTAPAPATDRQRARLHSEALLSPASLILRPAAIYGPHRGVHAAMRAGSYRLPENSSQFVSRIHVEDLAAHVIAALFSNVAGAWPVADEEPCASREIAEFCSGLLNLPVPASAAPGELGETRQSDRRVDGSAIRRRLGLYLKYPSYRYGIPACVAAEAEDVAVRAR